MRHELFALWVICMLAPLTTPAIAEDEVAAIAVDRGNVRVPLASPARQSPPLTRSEQDTIYVSDVQASRLAQKLANATKRADDASPAPADAANTAQRAPDNDNCENALPISEGTFTFNNSTATEDGLSHFACVDPVVSPLGTIAHDIWYCWTAPCDGPALVDTCESPEGLDTKIAVYEGCACLPTDSDLVTLGCNDDYCGWQSSVSFMAQRDQQYLIRIGTFPGDDDVVPPEPGGFGMFSVACVDLPCDHPTGHCQDFDPSNAILSNRTHVIAAEDFTPSVSGTLTDLCWWGSYWWLDFPAEDTFEVKYYESNGGLPGTLIGGPFRQSDGTLSVTEPVDNAGGVEFPVFEYTATHAPVPVAAGSCYWLEITNDTGATWYWQNGRGGNGSIIRDSDPVDGYQADDVCAPPEEGCLLALSACTSLPLGDSRCCEPPLAEACAGAVGDCLADNGSPGCEDETCCARVCACDPECCDIEFGWDEWCSGDGFVPGCGAAILCGAECGGGCETLVSSNPPHCAIDARQPRQPDGTNAQGWRQIELTFNEECDTATLLESDYVVEVLPGGTAPLITNVTAAGSSVTLEFQPFAELNKWTCLSHTSTLGRACLGYLPGNVNSDSTSSPAIDLSALIDCLNNPGSCADWQENINRDTAVNVADLTRLIDLYNGAAAYQSWTGASIDACPGQ